MSLESTKSRLQKRAKMLAVVRSFFAEKKVLEIDCNHLMQQAPIDANIDCLSIDQETAFLHTSPEYALKKFLTEGVGDCYFLGHVYRYDELGRLHNPEFTLAEWYRLNFTFDEMIRETCEFLSLFLNPLPIEKISYRKAFEIYLGIDFQKEPLNNLQLLTGAKNWSRSECLDFLLTTKIEPNLGKDRLTVLTHFPLDQAALAKTTMIEGEEVAMRFEIYFKTVELANGYHELSDQTILKNRFTKINLMREKANKAPYTIDEHFLNSLKSLPDCCGVAVGFDRALMQHLKANLIQEVMPFSNNGLRGFSSPLGD